MPMHPRPWAETSSSPILRRFISVQAFLVEVLGWASRQARVTNRSVVAQLLDEVLAALRGEVEHVPERLEGAPGARILPGIPRRVEELRSPEMPDRLPVAVEDVEHRPLRPPRGLGEVVVVVGVARRGEQAQAPPAALLPKRQYSLRR